MGKSVNTSKISSVDHNPTQIQTENGLVNPDKSGRVSLAYMEDGTRQWLFDGKEKMNLEDGFAVSTGIDKVPPKLNFAGVGDGKLRKAWESDEEYEKRMKEK